MRSLCFALIAAIAASAAFATPWFTQDPRTLPAGKWRVEEHVLYAPFEDALGHVSELLGRIEVEDAGEALVKAAGAVTGLDLQAVDREEPEEGIPRVRDGIAEAGQGHDLALILELAHVEEVRDVLEEDAE